MRWGMYHFIYKRKNFCSYKRYMKKSFLLETEKMMAGKTPIPVARTMRNIAQNLDLARRQQRIPMSLLAQRANVSVPTVRALLSEGKGGLETFLRVVRVLGLLDCVEQATDPLNTPIGRLRADDDTPLRVR